jgi:hypothetical protein
LFLFPLLTSASLQLSVLLYETSSMPSFELAIQKGVNEHLVGSTERSSNAIAEAVCVDGPLLRQMGASRKTRSDREGKFHQLFRHSNLKYE